MDRDEKQLDRPAEEQPKREERRQRRNPIWWGLCGAYLLYLAYSLLQSYRNGETTSAADAAVCLGGAILFALSAALLLFLAIRQGIQQMRQSAEDLRRVAEEDRLAEEARRQAEADEEAAEDEEDGCLPAPEDEDETE